MQKFSNNYQTTLSVGIDSTIGTIQVPIATVFDDVPVLSVGDYCYMTISDGTNQEIIKVTGILTFGETNTLTVTRDASENSRGAYSFAAGSSVKMNVTAEGLTDIVESINSAPTGSYPPAFTSSGHTWTGSTATQNITFNPMQVHQVVYGFDTYNGTSTYTINVIDSASYGTAYVFVDRASTAFPWPIIEFDGSSDVDWGGSVPKELHGVLQITKIPGNGGPKFVFNWLNSDTVSHLSEVHEFGTVSSGTTIDVYPAFYLPKTVYRGKFAGSTTLNFAWLNGQVFFREMYILVEGHTGVPSIKLNGSAATVTGTAPSVGVNGILKATMMTNAFARFQWV